MEYTRESYHFISARFVYSGLGAPIYISMPIKTPCPSNLHRSSSSVFFTISDRLVLICNCGSIGKEDGATWSHVQSFHPVLPRRFSSKQKESPNLARVIWENFAGSGSTGAGIMFLATNRCEDVIIKTKKSKLPMFTVCLQFHFQGVTKLSYLFSFKKCLLKTKHKPSTPHLYRRAAPRKRPWKHVSPLKWRKRCPKICMTILVS